MITLGIDLGFRTTKAAILDYDRLVASVIIPTRNSPKQAAEKVYDKIMRKGALNPNVLDATVATGYGRKSVQVAKEVKTDIPCHAKGAYFTNKRIRTVIDIGGRSIKVILLDEKGRIKDFEMNDNCAAGTGRFLENMADLLDLDVKKLGAISRLATKPAKIKRKCTVFAESEVVELLSRDIRHENIVAGVHNAMASRVAAIAKSIDMTPPVMLTGGVTRNAGVVDAIKKKIDAKVIVPRKGQVCGAIGAAILAVNRDLLLC